MLGKFSEKTVLNVSGATLLALASLFIVFHATPVHADVTYVSNASAWSNTVAMPSHQAGDLLVVAVGCDNCATIPTTPSGWTDLDSHGGTQSGNSKSLKISYQLATSSSHVTGTWTNANVISVSVYRSDDPDATAVDIGAYNERAITLCQSQTIYSALDFEVTDGTSLGYRVVNSGAAFSTQPTGYTALTARNPLYPWYDQSATVAAAFGSGGAGCAISISYTVELIEVVPPPPPPPPPIEALLASSTITFPIVTNFELDDVMTFSQDQMYMLFFGVLYLLNTMFNWVLVFIIVASIFVLIYSGFKWLRILK